MRQIDDRERESKDLKDLINKGILKQIGGTSRGSYCVLTSHKGASGRKKGKLCLEKFRKGMEKERMERLAGSISTATAFFILFLILWQFIGPRLSLI